MKIRRSYKRGSLATESVKLKLVGGDKDYCGYSAGYYAGKPQLTPMRKFCLHNPSATLKSLETVNYFDNIGVALAITSLGQIYKVSEVSEGNAFAYSGLVGTYLHSAFPCYYENAPAVIVISGPRITFVTAEKYYNKQIAFQLKGACIHMGRIFAADAKDGYSIRWSGTDFLDWTQSVEGSGYIRLAPERGKVFRTVPFGDRLVVFREYGIDVVKAYGDPRHFAIVHQGGNNVTEKLIEDTCVVCGGKIYFCSYTNIYCFDGTSITAVKLPDYMKASNFQSGKSYENRYVHFYCQSEADGCEYQLELDLVNGTCGFFAGGMKFVWKTNSCFWVWCDNAIYHEDDGGNDTQSTWRTESIDLGSSRVKTLKSIYVDKSEDTEITVRADGLERSFSESGESYVGMSGRNFSFEVSGGTVKSLEAEWEVRV